MKKEYVAIFFVLFLAPLSWANASVYQPEEDSEWTEHPQLTKLFRDKVSSMFAQKGVEIVAIRGHRAHRMVAFIFGSPRNPASPKNRTDAIYSDLKQGFERRKQRIVREERTKIGKLPAYRTITEKKKKPKVRQLTYTIFSNRKMYFVLFIGPMHLSERHEAVRDFLSALDFSELSYAGQALTPPAQLGGYSIFSWSRRKAKLLVKLLIFLLLGGFTTLFYKLKQWRQDSVPSAPVRPKTYSEQLKERRERQRR